MLTQQSCPRPPASPAENQASPRTPPPPSHLPLEEFVPTAASSWPLLLAALAATWWVQAPPVLWVCYGSQVGLAVCFRRAGPDPAAWATCRSPPFPNFHHVVLRSSLRFGSSVRLYVPPTFIVNILKYTEKLKWCSEYSHVLPRDAAVVKVLSYLLISCDLLYRTRGCIWYRGTNWNVVAGIRIFPP